MALKVIELFAGVGGFRLGLESASTKYKVVWSNQWEPATKSQPASDVYIQRFGSENHSNMDIADVSASDIPEHNILVGGFPCQDYSVARTLNQAAGLAGKKGVLWWEIHRIISESSHRPEVIFLENVDRLLKSPASQRGRDFAVMLASLSDLGYAVEWRVINAADYGMAQRRRRVFILAYLRGTKLHSELSGCENPEAWHISSGVFASAFKVAKTDNVKSFTIEGDLPEISDTFNKVAGAKSLFENCGTMVDRVVHTHSTKPIYDGKCKVLGDVLLDSDIPEEYYLNGSLEKWVYLKGAKKEKRVNKTTGFEYHYAEGSMVFPDSLDRPSRTIVTGEGGSTASRFKHVIQTADGRYRRLTPVELERLNEFPDNHTKGATDTKRAFFMGNALVVGVIKRIGEVLADRLDDVS